MELKLIDQGRTAEIFDIGNNHILKLFKKSIPFSAIENEFLISQSISKHNLPAPEFFGKSSYCDRTGLVYEHIQGQSMLKLFLKRPWRFFNFAKQLADIHFQLHTSKSDFLPCQKECLETFIKKTGRLSDEKKQIIIDRMKELKSGDSICHGDMHPDNILFSEDGPVLIDWMSATRGNPAADVAKTILILRYSKIPVHIPFYKRIISNRVKSLFSKIYFDRYIRISGITKREILQWFLPVAAARLYENGPEREKKALLRLINSKL